jgi:hypothetical protein
MVEANVPYMAPELFDRDIDLTHCSYHITMEHAHLDPLRLCAGREILYRDVCWTGRYIS